MIFQNFWIARYLVLFGPKTNDAIYYRIGYLIGQKSGAKYVIFLIIQESKLIQVVLLSLEKALTLRNFIIVIKSVFNKVQNHYNIFLEKCTYKWYKLIILW